MSEEKANGKETEPQEDLLPAIENNESKTALAILNKEKSEFLWKIAAKFARSAIVPEIFQDKQDDCYIALQMATRMKVDPLMLMSSAYVVKGKLGFEAKFAIGLMNKSDLIVGRLKYEEDPEPGTDPFDNEYKVRAFATDKETGQDVYGEWITWALVRAEGWDKDRQSQKSKWMTMPGQMFHYRAAIFFVRRHYPEVLLGMQTVDEVIDAEFTVTNTDRTQALKDRISGPPSAAEPSPAEECPHCKGRLLAGETSDCPHCGKPLMEKEEEGEATVGEYAEDLKGKQNELMALCDKIAGGNILETEKVLQSLAGTLLVDKVHGEDLDTAIKAAEERLKEKEKKGKKGKGKGKNSGELFDK